MKPIDHLSTGASEELTHDGEPDSIPAFTRAEEREKDLTLQTGAWLGQRYLAGFVDRVHLGSAIVVPMLVACAAILLVTAIAALRHVRLALTLQPAEALS